jgi:hypothetical protein
VPSDVCLCVFLHHFLGLEAISPILREIDILRHPYSCFIKAMIQSQSALLRLPAELRHEIHSYLLPDEIHVRLRGDKCYLAACFEHTNPWRRCASGHEREPWTKNNVDYRETKAVYTRRLQSTWGPHWMCEESALGLHQNVRDAESEERPDVRPKCKSDFTLLLVCKSM